MKKSRHCYLPLLAGIALALMCLWGASLEAQANAAGLEPAALRYVAPGGDCAGATPCYADLQSALDASAPGDEIRVAGGVYPGVSQRPRADVETTGVVTQAAYIDQSMTIRGGFSLSDWSTPDAVAHPTSLDAQGLGRVVYVLQGVNLTLENLRLIEGDATNLEGGPPVNLMDAGGGLYAFRASVTVSNCVLISNTASTTRLAWGGGLFLYEAPHATLAGNTFSANYASRGSREGWGGGLGVYGGDVALTGNLVNENVASAIRGGRGGGMYLQGGAIGLSGNDVRANKASATASSTYIGHGGGIYLDQSSAVLTENTIRENTGGFGGSGVGSFATRGGGIHSAQSDLTLSGNTIINNTGSAGGAGNGGGIYISGGSATLSGNMISGNTSSSADYGYGGGLSAESVDPLFLSDNLILDNRCSLDDTGIGGGVKIEAGAAFVSGNHVQGNIAGVTDWGRGGGLYLHAGRATLEANTIVSNTAVEGVAAVGWGGGVMASSVSFSMTNNIVAANHASTNGGGLYIQFPNNFSALVHNTIADNSGIGEGVYVNSSYFNPVFTNTILAGHSGPAVYATTGSVVTMDGTLWFANGSHTGGEGVFDTGNDETGDPAFVNPAAGDYHIGATSAAIDIGLAAGVAQDIDRQTRPQGSAPDIGADEYTAGPSAWAYKTAFAPQWSVKTDLQTGLTAQRLSQRYLIEFGHDDPLAHAFDVIDTLPAGLSPDWEWHTPGLVYQPGAGSLLWETQPALPAGETARILLATSSESVQPLAALLNQANVSGGAWSFDLQASTQAPLFPPQILSPGRGEICSQPGGVQVQGLAYPGETVKVYEDGVEVAQTTAVAGGEFTVSYTSSKVGSTSVSLTAVTCLQAGGQCSLPGKPVEMVPNTSFFCPQLSTWEDTPLTGPFAGQHLVYRFRDNTGRFVSNGWTISAPFSFEDTQLHLYVLPCPAWTGAPGPPDNVWVTVEDYGSFSPSQSSHPWYHFEITADVTQGYHQVTLNAACLPDAPGASFPSVDLSASGSFGIDLGGMVFDVTQGYHPGVSGVPGVTVTLMVSMSEWGGWVPWPAHAYGGQQNPQVTDDTGSFAYLAPPDLYYLQVEASPGFQAWRCPVITDVMRVNVPYTPDPYGSLAQVRLTPAGPHPAVVSVPVGSGVVWMAEIETGLPPALQLSLIDNPVIRLLSSLDPFLAVDGWDGGALMPGQSYRRSFTAPGTYTYSDGAGHSGTVIVGETQHLFLPVLIN